MNVAQDPDGCFTFCPTIGAKQTLLIDDCSGRAMVHGPHICYSTCFCPVSGIANNFVPCCNSHKIVDKFELQVGEFVLVQNNLKPAENRYEFGPQLLELKDPWETLVNPDSFNQKRAENMEMIAMPGNTWEVKASCLILGADEYLIIADKNGKKDTLKGPIMYYPKWGETWGCIKKSISIPVNSYIIIRDNNSTEHPITQKRGPLQYFPQSFEEVQINPSKAHLAGQHNDGREFHYDCFHVNDSEGIHVQCADGSVVLIDTPQFYMPKVGERILCTIKRQMLMNTDFCIMKAPNGQVMTIDGANPATRSFMVQPFHEFVYFMGSKTDESGIFILSTLPQFLTHEFMVRTSDNVELDLSIRISYYMKDINLFTSNPIQFVAYMQNYVQDDFLDRFAKKNLRGFMATFTDEALASIDHVTEFFSKFGIAITDIQILEFKPSRDKIKEMLEMDIHTNVIKQNELRATQNDVLIQEQNNEVMRRKKELDVAMTTKENQVRLRKKELGNAIRIKEMDIQIEEEKKRSELLNVRRGNDLIEYEFTGKCKGNNLYEFMHGIDANLTTDEKVSIWMRQMDYQQATHLYNQCPVTVVPPGADIKIFDFVPNDEDAPSMGGNALDAKKLWRQRPNKNLTHQFVSAQDRKKAAGYDTYSK